MPLQVDEFDITTNQLFRSIADANHNSDAILRERPTKLLILQDCAGQTWFSTHFLRPENDRLQGGIDHEGIR